MTGYISPIIHKLKLSENEDEVCPKKKISDGKLLLPSEYIVVRHPVFRQTFIGREWKLDVEIRGQPCFCW